jgi:hypothetical protein
MKLSEAMRKGCEMHAQAKGAFFVSAPLAPAEAEGLGSSQRVHREYKKPVIGTCALGSAFEGLVGRVKTHMDVMDTQHYGLQAYQHLFDLDVVPPCDCTATRRLSGVIMHLNDDLSWSREQIAAWLHEIGL